MAETNEQKCGEQREWDRATLQEKQKTQNGKVWEHIKLE